MLVRLFALASKYRIWTGTVAILAALLPLAGCEQKTEAAPPPPPEVQVVGVQQKDVPIYGEWVAILDGYVNADVRPQVTGYLIKQNYREGTLVHKGDVLFEIDTRPFEAAWQQTRGQQAQAEAQLGKTALDVQRDTPLAKQSAIPQAQLDNDIQANAAAVAIVDASKAQVEQARLNLEFTKVRSLVDGIAGIAKGQIGDLVGPAAILTTVSQLQPIKIYFSGADPCRREHLSQQRRNRHSRPAGRSQDRNNPVRRRIRQPRWGAPTGAVCTRTISYRARQRCIAGATAVGHGNTGHLPGCSGNS
jgi:membrane fusion protein (multidrug efflux system)